MTHEEISKRENETSELQIQVNRLEAILSRCVDVKGKARQATREYEEEDEEEKENAPIDVRLEETCVRSIFT